MYISARERKILDILLEKEEGTTVNNLAVAMEVSARTVHRDLKGVEDILKEYNLELIKKSGSGIQVTGEKEAREQLILYLYNLSHNEYTPEERQTFILSALLESNEPVKLLSIANELNVTIATISNDLNKVSERIEPYGLTLLRKRGYGIEIEGTETAKRRVMSSVIIQNINEFEFLTLIKENIQKKSSKVIHTITDRLMGLVDKKRLLIIEKQVEKIKNELPYSIADSAYIGLVVHLALALERVHQGENIKFDEQYLENLKNTKEYSMAKRIVDDLENAFKMKIPHGEVGYITMHLLGAKLRHDQDYLIEDSNIQLGIKAQNLIRYVGEEVGRDLTNHQSLFQGLMAHLGPAIYRISENMGISNPLLSRIESDYQDLFTIMEKAVKSIFPELSVPKEEIGYLVIHFASALLKAEAKHEFNALVICSTGIGTSKILATKLEKEIPEIKKIKNISLFELDHMDVEQYDVIISTIALNNYHGQYILVSPILSNEEIKKIKQFLWNSDLEQKEKLLKKNLTTGYSGIDAFQYLQGIQSHLAPILTVLERFEFEILHSVSSTKEALMKAGKRLFDEKIITDIDGWVEDLISREKLGGLGIPETTLGLYHARSPHVLYPSFTIFQLERPLRIKAMDDSTIELTRILLMVAPESPSGETMEILSQISSFIIKDQDSLIMFETKTKEDIFSYLAKNFADFIDTKLHHSRREK